MQTALHPRGAMKRAILLLWAVYPVRGPRPPLPESTVLDVSAGGYRVASAEHPHSYAFRVDKGADGSPGLCQPADALACCKEGAWYIYATKVNDQMTPHFTLPDGRRVPGGKLNSWGPTLKTLVPGSGLSDPQSGRGHLLKPTFVEGFPPATRLVSCVGSRQLRRSVRWAKYDTFSTLITYRFGLSLPWEEAWPQPPACRPLSTQTPLGEHDYAEVHLAARSFIEQAVSHIDFDWSEVSDFSLYAEYPHGAWPYCDSTPSVRLYLVLTADAVPPSEPELPYVIPSCTTPPPRPETFAPAARLQSGRLAFVACVAGTARHPMGLPHGGRVVRDPKTGEGQDARTAVRRPPGASRASPPPSPCRVPARAHVLTLAALAFAGAHWQRLGRDGKESKCVRARRALCERPARTREHFVVAQSPASQPHEEDVR